MTGVLPSPEAWNAGRDTAASNPVDHATGVRRSQQRDREAEALLARARAILRPSTPSPRRSEPTAAWRSRSPPTAQCWNFIRTSRRPTPRWGSRCIGCSATARAWSRCRRALELDPELITQRTIRRGSFRSVKELVSKIDAFVQAYNRTSKPRRRRTRESTRTAVTAPGAGAAGAALGGTTRARRDRVAPQPGYCGGELWRYLNR